MATEQLKITELTTKNSVDLANDHLVGVNGTSSFKMPMQKAIDEAKAASQRATLGNVFIYTIDNSGVTRFVQPNYLSTFQSQYNYTPIGIAVFDGTKHIIVALEESTADMAWSSASVETGGAKITSLGNVLNDWDGASVTHAHLQSESCQGVNTALGYCDAYSKLNGASKGLAAGKWHLPVGGEAFLFWRHYNAINYALSFVEGAMRLRATSYWTGTQFSGSKAWFINCNTGVMNSQNKTTTYLARPVATLL